MESLVPVFRWDKLYLGGGNAARIVPSVRAKLGPEVVFIPNAAGMNGGIPAWSMVAEEDGSLTSLGEARPVESSSPDGWDFPD